MPGGLLNITSEGDANVFLNGNPDVSLYRKEYKKITNFGLQKFRLDFFGQRNLRLTEESQFTFTVKNYADLLMDTYIVMNLPNIYSPIYPPTEDNNMTWSPYEFKWISDLGTQMIKEITITCGSFTLQKYSGQYLTCLVERDFNAQKKELYNRMTGNNKELNDPANAFGNFNTYPNVAYTANVAGAEPSIRGQQLYIPINTWFSLDSALGLPLLCLQYNELNINVTFRPIMEIFVVRDVFDYTNNFPYIAPDQNREELRFYRFLQTPPAIDISTQAKSYSNVVTNWNADIHLMATYCFLSDDERAVFAAGTQMYLIKDVFEYELPNIVGSNKMKLTSTGMVSSWMFYLQRNDAFMRNEWSNYTNWPYSGKPANITLLRDEISGFPLTNPDGTETSIFYTGDFNVDNKKEILLTAGVVLDGDYREQSFPAGLYGFIEKYVRTPSNAKDGIYCYNFCLNTDIMQYQPSGAMNLSKFRTIELEFTTYVPPIDPTRSQFNVICNINGDPIGVSKQNYRLYEYNFNIVLFEERYNVLSFIAGNAGMLYSR
jgi:hypothetical protein